MATAEPLPTFSNQDMMAAFASFGSPGLERYGAVSRIYDEFLRELQGPQGMKNFREMADNSAIAGAILFAAEHLMRRVTMTIQPKDTSQEAQQVAQLTRQAIFEDMEMTWPDQISEIMTMLPFGHALLEMRMKRRLGPSAPTQYDTLATQLYPVDDKTQPFVANPYKPRAESSGIGYPSPNWAPSRFSDGLIGFRSWELRAQETLYMWEFDEDSHPIAMQQMAAPDYRIRRIPLAKSLLFRTKVNKGNPEGKSILRNGWLDYYFSKNIQIFEGIGIERDMAGYPMIQIMKPDLNNSLPVPDVWNPKDPNSVMMLAQLKKMVRNVRRDEQEGMVMPWWAEFKLLSTGSRRSFDTNAIVSRHDQRIAMAVMADFILLGHEAVGSKALATTKVGLFTSALTSFLDAICAIINRQAIPLLLRMNGIDEKLSPEMTHGDVESVNLSDLGSFVSQTAAVSPGIFDTPEVRQALLAAAKLPTSGEKGADGTSLPDLRGGLDQL
jgi:hypothetical protein